MSVALIDTNVLVYAWATDVSDPRVARAKAVCEERVRAGDGCLSVQNLTEFVSVCLKKRKSILPPARVAVAVRMMIGAFRILRPSEQTVLAALDGMARHKLSFWDANVWAVARENDVPVILSEDFQHDRELEGVRFENPLR